MTAEDDVSTYPKIFSSLEPDSNFMPLVFKVFFFFFFFFSSSSSLLSLFFFFSPLAIERNSRKELGRNSKAEKIQVMRRKKVI